MIERLPRHEVNSIEIVTWEGLRRPDGSPFVITHKNLNGMVFWDMKERDEFRRMFPGVIAEQTSWGGTSDYADYANRLGPKKPIAVISLSQQIRKRRKPHILHTSSQCYARRRRNN